MASTLSQKWLTIFFLPKSSKVCIFRTIWCCSNFRGMWSKYLPNNVWRNLRLPLVVSNNNMKCPIRKWIFAINLELKLFQPTTANVNIESVKSLPTLFYTCLDHMLVKFEQNRMVRRIQNSEFFWQKLRFFKPIFD